MRFKTDTGNLSVDQSENVGVSQISAPQYKSNIVASDPSVTVTLLDQADIADLYDKLTSNLDIPEQQEPQDKPIPLCVPFEEKD